MASLLTELLTSQKAVDSQGKEVALHSGLGATACTRLQRLVREERAANTLEVGMGMGVSTLAFLEALPPDGSHTAIDPMQTAPVSPSWFGIGVETVRRARLPPAFRLLEEPGHVALPRLLSEGRKFDLILIDGWHTFDTSFIDFYYSDLLLRDGGVLVFDDWGIPAVYHVTQFVETHKAYERLGPSKLYNPMGLRHRLHLRRGGYDAWGSLCAYRKLKTTQVPGDFYHSNFYPGYWIYKWWAKLRGHVIPTPF